MDNLIEVEKASSPSRVGKWLRLILVVVALCGLGWLANYSLIGRPVSVELRSDSRNAAFNLNAHYQYYVKPNTLVLNLSDVENAAPLDLFRGLFQAAEAMHRSGREFDRVVLSRSRKTVFVVQGSYFKSLGANYGAGENPVYLIRTLPENLYRSSGESAFGTWEGGWLGVVGKQMEDANEAARRWAAGG
jgi:hypothetical protein